jgi:hypothetical protein
LSIYPCVLMTLATTERDVNILYSIVAIHDLYGHREESFTAHNGVNWLRDLLPHDIPNARILACGYDGNGSQQTLHDISIDLIAKLSIFREYSSTNVCPPFLTCSRHSLSH